MEQSFDDVGLWNTLGLDEMIEHVDLAFILIHHDKRITSEVFWGVRVCGDSFRFKKILILIKALSGPWFLFHTSLRVTRNYLNPPNS
jgi:hypothetical protein